MHPIDDQLSRLLKSAADQTNPDAPAGALTPRREDAVIRAWRAARNSPIRGWFDGLLAPGIAVAGAAMALAFLINYQSLIDERGMAQTVELETMIADSSTRLALLP